MMNNATEARSDFIRCRYCRLYFKPEPTTIREGKRTVTYVECPRCGNGGQKFFRKKVRRNG